MTKTKLKKPEPTSPTPENKEPSNNLSAYSRSAVVIRSARINALGLINYPQQRIPEMLDHAIQEGESSENVTTHKKETSDNEPDNKATAEKKASYINTLTAKSKRLTLGIKGSLILSSNSRKKFIDDAIENGKRDNQDETDVNDAPTQDEPPRQKRIASLFYFSRGVPKTIYDRAEHLGINIKESGRSVDFRIRQRALTRSQKRSEFFGEFLSKLGVTSQNELHALNKRVNDFIEATETFIEKSDHTSIKELERRHNDRRRKSKQVDYEMRLCHRRDAEKRAA